MAWTNRFDYAPQNPFEKMHDGFSKAWHNASNAAYDGAARFRDQGGYTQVIPAFNAQAMGEFGLEKAKARWDKLTDLYGAGVMAWNAIRSIQDNPCGGQWGVMVDLALPIAGDTLIILLTPSPQEVLEEYLDPKQARSGARSGKRKRDQRRRNSKSGKRRRSWGGVPDPDGMTASVIPGAAAMQGRNAFEATRWFFSGIAIADLDAFTWMLVDLAAEDLVQWSSGMREARFCSKGFNVIYTGEQTGPVTARTFAFSSGNMDPKAGQNLEWFGGNLRLTAGPDTAADVTVIAAVTVLHEEDGPEVDLVSVIRPFQGAGDGTNHGKIDGGETKEVVMQASGRLDPGEDVNISVFGDPAVPILTFSGGVVQVYGNTVTV